jgi:hypothetical protein
MTEEVKPVPGVAGDEELRIGVYVCHCGSNIAGVIPPKEVVDFAGNLVSCMLLKPCMPAPIAASA